MIAPTSAAIIPISRDSSGTARMLALAAMSACGNLSRLACRIIEALSAISVLTGTILHWLNRRCATASASVAPLRIFARVITHTYRTGTRDNVARASALPFRKSIRMLLSRTALFGSFAAIIQDWQSPRLACDPIRHGSLVDRVGYRHPAASNCRRLHPALQCPRLAP